MGEAKEGVIVMVAAYNLYLGGYLPRLDPVRSVHNRQELKTKYKNIFTILLIIFPNPKIIGKIAKTNVKIINKLIAVLLNLYLL